MFRIEPTPWPEGSQGQPGRRVIDPDRNVWLQFIHGSRARVNTMKLVWKDEVIPFEISLRGFKDDPPGGTSYVWHFERFEGTTSAQNWGYVDPSKGGVTPYHFDDPSVRREAQLLAVEALLVYGGNYDGETSPDGYYRVEFEGKLYRKSDFGMAW